MKSKLDKLIDFIYEEDPNQTVDQIKEELEQDGIDVDFFTERVEKLINERKRK